MTEREVLKLALKCAERCESIDGMYSWSDTITAIKEALAQPEQEPETLNYTVHVECKRCGSHERYDLEIDYPPQPKEPEQEPVIGTKTWFEDGKVVTQNLTAKDIYKDLEQPEPEPVAWAQFSETGNLIDLLEEPCGGYVPLYTTPPPVMESHKRKPLSEAQLEKGRAQTFSINNPFCPCDSKTFRKVARWVEAAHDIKE